MKVPLQAFKAAQIFVPANVQEMQVNLSNIDELTVFLFVDASEVQQLKTELPHYIATCQEVDTSYNVRTFWKNHVVDLPH